MNSVNRATFVVAVLVLMLGTISWGYPLLEDLETAASGHDGGRVQIKVYRGPTEHDGHDHFAPWGYWVKQPADDGHH